jgi:hypothetical protein
MAGEQHNLSGPNQRVNPPVRPVTVLAGARPAPVRPAGYADRWTANEETKRESD